MADVPVSAMMDIQILASRPDDSFLSEVVGRPERHRRNEKVSEWIHMAHAVRVAQGHRPDYRHA
jgi:hypothetical protein